MIMALAVLTGCSGQSKVENTAREIQAEYLSATKLNMMILITADYGSRVYDYKIKYSGDANIGKIEIMEPESIAGLTAEVSVSGTSIEYDGVRLETGSLDKSGLSPLDALPVIISQ